MEDKVVIHTEDRNKVIVMQGAARDITERKQADAALRESEARFRTIVDTSPDCIFINKGGDNVIYINNEGLRLLGATSPDQIIGKAPFHFIHPDSHAIVRERIKQVIALDPARSVPLIEEKYLRLDGTPIDVEVAAVPLDYQGERAAYVVVRDITARKRAEKLLARSRDFYLGILEEFPAMIWRSDVNAKCDYFNKTWLSSTGRTLEQELGDGWAEGVHPDDVEQCVTSYLNAFHARKPFVLEYRLRRHDGEYRYILDYGSPFNDLDGNFAGYIGSGYDITERRRAEQKLNQTAQQLHNLAARLHTVREEEATRIARDVHDQLGQVLTSLKFDLTWLAERLPKRSGTLREKVFSMTQLVETTINTVRKISTELRPAMLAHLGLPAAVEWWTQEFQRRTGIACVLSLASDELPVEPHRAITLFRILQESLTNVSQHAHATRVEIALKADAEQVHLEIRDNGRGIPDAQIDSPTSLGLTGMRERALQFGGTVRIQGKPGHGTTVTVSIPLDGPG